MLICKNWDKSKMKEQLHGLYLIQETRTNGTVRLIMDERVTQTVHIKKLRPYQGPPLDQLPMLQHLRNQQREYRKEAEQQGILLPITEDPIINI